MKISGLLKFIDNGESQGLVPGTSWLKIYYKSHKNESKWLEEPIQIKDGEYEFDTSVFEEDKNLDLENDLLYMFFYWNRNNDTDNDINSLKLSHTGMIKSKIKEKINSIIDEVKEPSVLFEFNETIFDTKPFATQCSERSKVMKSGIIYSQCSLDFYQEVFHPYRIDGIYGYAGYGLDCVEYNWGDGEKTIIKKYPDPTFEQGKSSSAHRFENGRNENQTIKITVKNFFGKEKSAVDFIKPRKFEDTLNVFYDTEKYLRRIDCYFNEDIEYNFPDFYFYVLDKFENSFIDSAKRYFKQFEICENAYIVRYPLKSTFEEAGDKYIETSKILRDKIIEEFLPESK